MLGTLYNQNGKIVVIPSKPVLSQRFADNIYSSWKFGDNVFFDPLKDYHSNIKLIIRIKP